MTPPPLLVIAGATATGKSGLAIATAVAVRDQGVPVEIVSADSRQVYRGLDIGTAKVPPGERAGIAHHGLDLVDPDEPFSVADFVSHARAVLAAIPTGGLAILVGGTGLYLRAVARGLATEALASDPAVRARVEADLARDGLPALAARLATIAPSRAAAVDLRNPRRVVRALEMAELQGDVVPPAPRGYGGPVAWIGLDVDRATHARWIEARARGQFDAGLVEEARSLRERYDPSLPAFSAIGYREAWALLDGAASLEAAIAADAGRNVAFARRQRTWFRSEPGVEWLDAAELAPARATAIDRARALLDGAARGPTGA